MSEEKSFSQMEIDAILTKYKEQKEYRRVYYNNKYKNDPEYSLYIRDYNKFRYEHLKCEDKINNGGDPIQCELFKAIKMRDWYIKSDRSDIFITKYPDLNKILCINASNVSQS